VIGQGMKIIAVLVLLLLLYVILGFKKPGIALITSPIACFLVACAGVFAEMLEAVLYAPVIFVATLAAVSMSRREPDSEEWPQKWAKRILIGLVFLLLFATAAAVFGPLGIIGSVFFALFVMLVISYALTSREATAAYVLSTIGSSMRQNLPLPMALESAASGQIDKRAKILTGINKWLVQGYSLSESLKRGFPKCPSYAVAMIAAAERINQLPLAIKAIEEDMAAKADERRKIRPVCLLYPVILISFMFIMVLGLMQFVIPKFQSALIEMMDEAQLPAATQFLSNIVNYLFYEKAPVFWGALAFIVFVAVPLLIRIRFRPRRPEKPYLLSRIGDFIKWHLPVLHWFEENYSLVQVVELLRLSLNAGSPVNDAITNTLGLDVNDCLKKRLQKWLAKVEAGDNIATAAKETKLGRPLVWAFDEQVNQGNTPAILEMLESFYRSNYSYRVNLAKFVMEPCIIIVMGLTVGFVVFAIFAPLVKIISYGTTLVTP